MKKTQFRFEDYIERGQFYLLNQKFCEAIKQFQKALELKPDPMIYYQLGLAYEGANKASEAREMYRKALELNPALREAAERLKNISS
ncbi:MAG: tetratricopeptide repeat protein [candidate division WOR-3 bacterium]